MLVAPEFARIVGEWRPPTFHQAWPFFLLALVAVWLVARAGRRLTGFEKLALLATVVLGFLAVRNITWFAYASLLLAPAALEASWPAAPGLRRPGFAIRSLACASALALPVTFFVLALLPASTYESRWPESALRAVERVAERDPSARVFASERYADWLLWKKPELAGRVAFDVRFELYSDAELGSIFRYRNRIGADWRRLTRGYDLLVLDRLTDGRLEPSLSGEPGTRRLYRDEAVSVLYRPAG
jgi:hypothetical protein